MSSAAGYNLRMTSSVGFAPRAIAVLLLAGVAGAALGWFRQTVGASVPATTFVTGALIGWALAPRAGVNGLFGLIVVAGVALVLVTVPPGIVTAGELYLERVAAMAALATESPGSVIPVAESGIRWGGVFGLIAMPVAAGTGVAGLVGWMARDRDGYDPDGGPSGSPIASRGRPTRPPTGGASGRDHGVTVRQPSGSHGGRPG